jgi:hypothetical protein
MQFIKIFKKIFGLRQVRGISASECSNRGLCDRNTGASNVMRATTALRSMAPFAAD